MPIVIDGWNFIRDEKSRIQDIEADSLDAARQLISMLEKFQGSHRDPIVLVFDSTNERLGIKYDSNGLLSVIAARNADSYIIDYVEKVPQNQRKNVRVVSSDKEVFHRARDSYATAMKSEEFWEKLNRDNSHVQDRSGRKR